MKKILIVIALIFFAHLSHADFQIDSFLNFANRIQVQQAAFWPLLHNGRIKPLNSLSRETTLFITGRYSFKGLDPEQFFFGIMSYANADQVPCIEARSPELRKELGLPDDRRLFSLKELQATSIQERVQPLIEKEKTNRRLVSEFEKKTLELAEQMWLFQSLQSGSLLLGSMEPQSGAHATASHMSAGLENSSIQELQKLSSQLLATISAVDATEAQQLEAKNIENQIYQKLLEQKWPTEVAAQLGHSSLEVFYNRVQPFRWACILLLLIGLMMFFPGLTTKLSFTAKAALGLTPLLMMIAGFALRILITGFAPVTSMYGTMLWVSLGLSFFGWCFYLLYKNHNFLGLIFVVAGLILLLTDQIPLVLSPDMDPIVAVLRSNLWLTIHVLTITVSYAALSIAMILGNSSMILLILGRLSPEWVKSFGHYTYRAIQLGVFLLSVGIILGGIWADYSWGRFWGWDPKETWALIADLGFLALLHARLVGWIDNFKLLLLSPMAYLLVIMAWYGVNFILAAGLHSYGFSSGGTKIVFGFVILQMCIFAGTAFRRSRSGKSV